VRDVFPYVDYGLKDSVELSDLFAVMTSDQKADQVEMNDGSYANFVPSRKLKLSINKTALLESNIIRKEDSDKLTDVMEWDFKKNYATKPDLAIFDILVHNNWKRPVYFESSVSNDTYMGLDKYLYLEGYAYRLLPFKTDKKDKEERTNTSVMYSNVMNKLEFSGFKKAAYMDPESRRVLDQTWRLHNTLAGNLLAEGKKTEAHRLMVKSLDELPVKNYSIRDSILRLGTITNLYDQQDLARAGKLTTETANFLTGELHYMVSLEPKFQEAYLDDARLGFSVLQELAKLTEQYGQLDQHKKIMEQLSMLQRVSSGV
jgi:hypothetical protein